MIKLEEEAKYRVCMPFKTAKRFANKTKQNEICDIFEYLFRFSAAYLQFKSESS